MTPQHIELIKSTIPVLREHGVALTQHFYQRMLKNHPELKNTFNLDHQSSGMQPRALAAAVLAYAENIENPSVLAAAIERISTKHVSLNIQAEQYNIVGENLLHAISEVLNIDMDCDLITAWKAAYLQLADILINAEKNKYDALQAQTGAWTGWRQFNISHIQATEEGTIISFNAIDQQPVLPAQAEQLIQVRVKVPTQNLYQPQPFQLKSSNLNGYQIMVKAEEKSSTLSVIQVLMQSQVGDLIELSTPFSV